MVNSEVEKKDLANRIEESRSTVKTAHRSEQSTVLSPNA